MNINDIKNLLERNKSDIAFIVGNGINRHFNDNNNISWEDLLLDLWDKYLFSTQSTIPDGISFTEFYDILEINNYETIDNFNLVLQKDIKENMLKWNTNDTQNIVINKIKSLNAPLLTVNFDDLIPKSMNLDFHKIHDSKFSDFYPWSCYYSDRILDNPTEGFGVWYINGMVKYHRSIKLGLSQYMGNVGHARKLIHNNIEAISFVGKNQNYWEGYETWLHIIFNKSLFIFGFGLGEQEIFMRWLLIERAKYFKKFPERKHKGWFLVQKNSLSDGQKLFFHSVGIEVIEVENYQNIYQDIWE